MRIRAYPQIGYAAVEVSSNEAIPTIVQNYVQLSIPAEENRHLELRDKGFIWIDRTLDVKVPIAKSK